MTDVPTFTCPKCGATSAHPKDVEEGYCGNCHRWTRACNLRPPEGHPMHDWGVACHLPQDHLDYGESHSWDIDAAVARHEIVTGALTSLRERFPGREIERFDNGIPHPIVAYDVGWICEECEFRTDVEEEALAHSDKRKHSLARGRVSNRPYRVWEQHAGPWLTVIYEDGEEFAIWKVTGAVYRVGPDGAVDEDPIIPGSE